MGTHYHRGQNQAIPAQPQYRSITRPGPPQDHYLPNTGQWDGQLPNSDIADQSNDPAQHQSPNWPTLLERMLWTRKVIRSCGLTAPQAAVLNEIAFRDGRGLGCTATMETLALDTGYNEKSIRRAIQPLEQKKIIIAHGNPGQKKIMGLPVKDGQLPWPTPDRESGVSANEQPQPRTESPGLTPTSDRESGVVVYHHASTPDTKSGLHQQTPDRESGVNPNPGHRVRATPDTESDITLSKHNKEREEYINISLFPGSLPGYPDRESGIAPIANPEPRWEEPESPPTSDRESEVTNERQEQELERIRALVVQNWPLLEKNGWRFLEAAIRHYQTHGITYLHRDLRIKRENLEKEERATRTCAHCNTVHESTDHLSPCAMCHEPMCVSQLNPCHRIGCDGTPAPRNRSGPKSRQRR